ncbi:MAG: diaminopimelate epimerase [Chloroflexi bacterium]|nr:diaminopimelate epimerase [Chloroflexota bacterium]
MDFVKMHSSGNDFVIVREDESRRVWGKLSKVICDRRFGVGADGVLIVLPSNKADFRVRVINSDGSEAEICGNGLICLGKYACEAGIVAPDASEVKVETKAGIKNINLVRQGGKVQQVRVVFGHPRFRPEQVPALVQGEPGMNGAAKPVLDYTLFAGNRKLLLNMVSMGNPHAVCFTGKPVDDFPLNRLGPIVEHHPIFPQRVNFEVARIVDSGRIEARVWERGAGETLACGSGACAIAVTARLHGFVGSSVEVALPGGKLKVEWDGSGEVALTGSPELVFKGAWLNDGGL